MGAVCSKVVEAYKHLKSPLVDRIRLWVSHNKIPIYPMFYLLKADYNLGATSPEASQHGEDESLRMRFHGLSLVFRV